MRPGSPMRMSAHESPETVLPTSVVTPAPAPRPTPDLVQAARDAWLECEGLHPLPEPVWKLLSLVPELCAAAERSGPAGALGLAAGSPVGRLTRLFAHELRNRALPLGMALQTLAVDGDSREAREQTERQLRLLLEGVERLAGDLSRLIDLTPPEAAPLRRLAAEVFDSHRLEADALGVALVGVADLTETPVDAARCRLVLSNLVLNGIRFADRAKPERWVRLAAGPEPGAPSWWRVEVADNGVGISEPLQSHLLRGSLRRPDDSYLAGLGLPITREAVEQMGGRFGLASRSGLGTTVSFTVSERSAADRG
jgi:signal transduction histidine kinase